MQPIVKKEVSFLSAGITLSGWLFTAESSLSRSATLILSPGFSALKEHFLEQYATAFALNGYTVLLFDNRNFGSSSGALRYHINPYEQITDIQNAITFMLSEHKRDKQPILYCGFSYSGGHALVLRAIERRLHAVITVTPMIDGYQNAVRQIGKKKLHASMAKFAEERLNVWQGKKPQYVAVVAKGGAKTVALPGVEAYEFFTACSHWHNSITLLSLEHSLNYAPLLYSHSAAETPIFYVTALQDSITHTDLQQQAFTNLPGNKQQLTIHGGHFSPYKENFQPCITAMLNWLAETLN